MPFILRKDHKHGAPQYLAIRSGFRHRVEAIGAKWLPDDSQATRFDTLDEAERWRNILSGEPDVVLVSVG
jgi:hypothetical protein